MPDLSGDIGDLIASVQGALADARDHTDDRAKRVLVRAADVQARCAQAIATQNLADAVWALVATEENQ
jgi:hypothetical protein